MNRSISACAVVLSFSASLLFPATALADATGAIVGGLIGAQIGKGNGRVAAAAIGAVIGDRMTTAEQPSIRTSPSYPQTGGVMYHQPAQQSQRNTIEYTQPSPTVVYQTQNVTIAPASPGFLVQQPGGNGSFGF